MKKMRAFAGLTLTLALLLCTGCSGGAQSINQSGNSAGADDNSGTASVTYRFAGTMPESHHMSKAMAMVADEMSQKTDGKINFDMYYSNSLYKDAEMVEVVPEGAVEIVQTNLGQWTGVVPEISIFNMHTIFRDNEHFLAVQADQEMFDVIDKALQEKANCKLLAWIDFGQNTILSKKPISTMEDLKGKVIRCDSEYAQYFISALGGAPQSMSVADVYSALEKGVVDGAIAGFSSFIDRSWYEVGSYVVDEFFTKTLDAFVCNLDWWNGLSADEQAMLQSACQSAYEWTCQASVEAETSAKEALAEKGVELVQLTPEERARWEEAVTPAESAKLVSQLGQEEADQLLAIVERNR